MAELKISLFGGLELEICAEGAVSKGKKKHLGRPAQLLLSFILLHRNRPHKRESLADKIWPRQNTPQGRLRTTLWRLKESLEPTPEQKGTYVTVTGEGEISFNNDCFYWLDIAEFEKSITSPITSNERVCPDKYLDRIDKALELYRGDLLEGFYEEWIVRERERLRCLYIETLEHQFYFCLKHNAYHRALSYARRVLDHDPIREHIHRDVMRIYAACHRRAEALRQYKICVDILKRELDIVPMEETSKLYDDLRLGSGFQHSNVSVNEIEYLHGLPSETINGLNEAKQHIENAITDITKDLHRH